MKVTMSWINGHDHILGSWRCPWHGEMDIPHPGEVVAWWSQAGRAMAGAAVLGPALAAQGSSGQELGVQVLIQHDLGRILGMGRWNLTSHRCRTQGWDVRGGCSLVSGWDGRSTEQLGVISS